MYNNVSKLGLGLGGQALSLVPYNIWVYFCSGEEESSGEDEESVKSSTVDVTAETDRLKLHSMSTRQRLLQSSRKFSQSVFTVASEDEKTSSHRRYSTQTQTTDGMINEEEKVEEGECSNTNIEESIKKNRNSALSQSVSTHGLPSESRTEKLISRIPWYLKPIIPAFFNLLNSCMRWTSLLFVAASIAEMLISGMELVLSVLASRCVRGRRITCVRWIGVAIVTVGIILVGIFDTRNANIASQGDDSANTDGQESTVMRDQVIGILLILGQSIMSVLQDITEEVFMQEAAFPPALLVGMEGLFGLIIALILYFPLAPLFGEKPSAVLEDLQSNGKIVGLSIGWALLVTVTGVFNIAATGVTSSMTRNVWKNFRTALIWIVSLIIFYATGNPELGEEWFVPGSFYILIGFTVMLGGIYVYYGKGSKA